METMLYENSYHGNTYETKTKPHQKNNFSILNQGLQAATGSKLPTNYNYLSQNYTAILHTSTTNLELLIFFKPNSCLNSRI